MLEEVRITGLGVIDDAVLELSSGFTVLTGETGAGKTMVVTALGLLFGASFPALRALTTALADERHEVILAVVDRDLFVWLDLPARAIDDDRAAAFDRFGIRSAGVVDVARHVPTA